MFGILNQFEEHDRVKRLKNDFKTAKDLGQKECAKCGCCCHCRTCIPTPDELKNIAEFLKLTPKETINKYYAIDRISHDDAYYVKPLGENQKDLAGKFIPASRTFNEGKCIFLNKNNTCRIHKVRPKSAKIQRCWDDDPTVHDIQTFWKPNRLFTEFGIKIDEDSDE